jgi:SynChlorMet cassette radical SAM/SPASM protein ScmE
LTSNDIISFIQDLTSPSKPIATGPDEVETAVTGRCNLSCQYCYYADFMQKRGDLPTERWLAFFEELGQLCVRRVTITGGEPFLRPDLFRLIDGIIENRMRYRILTNGTLITDEIISAFREGKRRKRLDFIQVSIDGSCAEIHDLSRPRSFDRALHGLRLLKNAGFPVTVRVTLNPHNIRDIENIARLLIDDVGIDNFMVNETDESGAACNNPISVVLSDEDRLYARKIFSSLIRKYEGKISSTYGPLAVVKKLKDIDTCIAQGKTEIPGGGTISCCGRVFGKIAVLHDGTMVPCINLPTLVMGVIGMHPLKEVWITSPAINAVRLLWKVPLSGLPECNGCKYLEYCLGGCPSISLRIHGRLTGIDPMWCYKKYFERGEEYGNI